MLNFMCHCRKKY